MSYCDIMLWTSCCGHSVPSGANPVHMPSVYGEVSQWLQHLPLKLSHSKLQKPENNGEQYAMSFTIPWPVDYMSVSRVTSMWVISYLATHNWTRRARRNKNRIKSIELFSSGVQQGRLEHRSSLEISEARRLGTLVELACWRKTTSPLMDTWTSSGRRSLCKTMMLWVIGEHQPCPVCHRRTMNDL